MGSKKKKKSNSPDCEALEPSLESVTPKDLSNAKHIQLIPIEAGDSIAEFMKEMKNVFLPEFTKLKEEYAELKKENKALKYQLHDALGKIEALENGNKCKNLIIRNLPSKDDIQKSTLNFLSKK